MNIYDIISVSDGFIIVHSPRSADNYCLSKINKAGSAYDTSWGNNGHNGDNLYPAFWFTDNYYPTSQDDGTYSYFMQYKGVAGVANNKIQRCEIYDQDGTLVNYKEFESAFSTVYYGLEVFNDKIHFITRDLAPAYNDYETWTMDFEYESSEELIGGSNPLYFILPDGYTRTIDTTTYFRSSSGYVESVCVIPGTTEDEVWVSVVRVIDGEIVRYVEQIQPRIFGDQEDAFFVDCGIKYDSTPTDTITGLDHLEGETVQVWGDGLHLSDQVVSGGEITISEGNVSVAIVGLPYTYILHPMRLDTKLPQYMASYKRIPEIALSFKDTLYAKYGHATDDLYDFDWKILSDLTADDVLFTGLKSAPLDGGYSTEDNIYITGEEPAPCIVRGIVPKVKVTGR